MVRACSAPHARSMQRLINSVRNLVRFTTTSLVAVAVVLGIASPTAHAQTGNVAAYCAASIASNDAGNSKTEILAAIDTILAVAPAEVAEPGRTLRELLVTKGKRGVESAEGRVIMNRIGAYDYANCPGNAVQVTATDFEYQGMPATLPAGLTKFKVVNTSSTEEHEMIFVKLTPAGENVDPA